MGYSVEAIGDVLRGMVSRRGIPASGTRTLVGLAGRGIQGSRSPVMHEREAARLGIDCTYVLIDFDKLELPDEALGEVVRAAAAVGFAGINVTHPFKQAVIPYLDTLAPEASAIGAVNTVVFAGASSAGHNTDVWGFAESFHEGMPDVALGRVVQFGAGGAGAAVAYALMDLGVDDLALVDSNMDRAQSLCERISRQFGARVRVGAVSDLPTADGLVNTTPVGMANYPGTPFAPELLLPRHWVAEIIYFPAETELLRRARVIGCRTLAGAGMAIYQAVRAFELFNGRAPDRAAMAGHFETAA